MMRMGWIVAPTVGLAACLGALAWSAQEPSAPQSDTYRQLSLFAEVLAQVRSDYVEEIDDAKVMEAAIQGMLNSLDPHSAYLSSDDFKDMKTQTRGEYGGLGIEVTQEDGVVRVVAPMDDTPASRAGIMAGDFLTAIDGESIIGLSINDAVAKMRGPVGTSLEVTVARDDKEPFEVKLTREIISVKSVAWRMEEEFAVVRVSAFNEKTTDALEEALRAVKAQAGPRLKGLVLDLRNNPGGLLEQAIGVSDAFLDGGSVVSTQGRHAANASRYSARRGEFFPGLPVVVLINGGSASASEIVAGALQDRNRAVVLGTTSFGKGSVQTVIPLKGGRDGALRLTTARYYTPAGRSIQGAGIEPDFEVAAVRADPEKPRRIGAGEADLPGALENDRGAKRREAHTPADQPPEGWPEAQDYQLKRAKDMLRQGQVLATLKAREG